MRFYIVLENGKAVKNKDMVAGKVSAQNLYKDTGEYIYYAIAQEVMGVWEEKELAEYFANDMKEVNPDFIYEVKELQMVVAEESWN